MKHSLMFYMTKKIVIQEVNVAILLFTLPTGYKKANSLLNGLMSNGSMLASHTHIVGSIPIPSIFKDGIWWTYKGL